MRVGIEGNNIHDARIHGGRATMDFARKHGLDGVFLKSVLQLSQTLDSGELREAREYADDRGLYLEVGAGRVNPYNTAESLEIRELGGGDYLLGMERLIRAACGIGCTEIWAELATYKRGMSGYFAFDRFRTDVTWADQLDATRKFLLRLASILRDLGCRLNIETHEEVTSFEVVRLVESVGPEVVGITFDIANVLARGEDPLAATGRVAPYTHTTHFKDAILYFVPDGLVRQGRPIGGGIIDWEAVIDILAAQSPELNLTIEGTRGLMPIPIFDATWQSAHPDLTIQEFAEVVRLARASEDRIARGEIAAPDDFSATPWQDRVVPDLLQSATHLRSILAEKGLSRPAS